MKRNGFCCSNFSPVEPVDAPSGVVEEPSGLLKGGQKTEVSALLLLELLLLLGAGIWKGEAAGNEEGLEGETRKRSATKRHFRFDKFTQRLLTVAMMVFILLQFFCIVRACEMRRLKQRNRQIFM